MFFYIVAHKKKEAGAANRLARNRIAYQNKEKRKEKARYVWRKSLEKKLKCGVFQVDIFSLQIILSSNNLSKVYLKKR